MDLEIGAELSLSDLRVGKVVVIAPPGHSVHLTMWIQAVTAESVIFYSGIHKWAVTNFVKDGHLVDDQDRTVRVFGYLGKP